MKGYDTFFSVRQDYILSAIIPNNASTLPREVTKLGQSAAMPDMVDWNRETVIISAGLREWKPEHIRHGDVNGQLHNWVHWGSMGPASKNKTGQAALRRW